MATKRRHPASTASPNPPIHRAGDRSPNANKDGYFYLSTRPLYILLFLLPGALLYEIGSVRYLSNPDTGTVDQIRAERLMRNFFELFDLGDTAVYLPGIMLIAVLFVWHILLGDPWRCRGKVLLGMLAESIAWTIPLLVLSHIIARATGLNAAAAAAAAPAVGDLAGLSVPARATIAIGAGVYEEMLFRLFAIAAVHLIIADLLRVKEPLAKTIAVVLAAIAFALYHDVARASGGIDMPRLINYLAAGLFFGGLYVARGFGIVVAVHATYDLIVLVLLNTD